MSPLLAIALLSGQAADSSRNWPAGQMTLTAHAGRGKAAPTTCRQPGRD
jgi:hypothetical protein